MTLTTVRKLNELNQQFYHTVALAFSESRSQAWEGWLSVLPFIYQNKAKSSLSVLDLGCGNGRFGQFLSQQLPDTKLLYTGTDSSSTLLAIAQQKLKGLNNLSLNTSQQDLVEDLISNRNSQLTQYDLVVAFGVLHHIPSNDLRQKFMEQIANSLTPNGVAIFSLWNFIEIPNLMARAVSPEQFGFSSSDLEKNDYFLTWERGPQTIRYCHYTDPQEIKESLKKAALLPIKTFFADGKNHQLNHYIICSLEKN